MLAYDRRHDAPSISLVYGDAWPDTTRRTARALGADSAFEFEVGAALFALDIPAEHHGPSVWYLGPNGKLRGYRPDFVLLDGTIVEAKGLVRRRDREIMEAINQQFVGMDVRMVFQNPHRRGGVEGSTLTPAEWANGLGLPWCGLDDLDDMLADVAADLQRDLTPIAAE